MGFLRTTAYCGRRAFAIQLIGMFGSRPPPSTDLAAVIADLLKFAPASPPRNPTYNALAEVLMPATNGSPVPNPFTIPPPPARLTASSVTPRKVFYSFHHDDVNRVNLVRNSGRIRPIDRERRKTVFDKSLWERSRSASPEALKRSINRALSGTSATCLLVGEHTWSRPWVRYEIARSLLIGNGIFAVRIDGLQCMNRGYGYPGPNPLDYMAVGRDLHGRIHVYESDGYDWMRLEKLQHQIFRWPKWLQDVPRGCLRPLSHGAPIYDYQTEYGSERLLIWANAAAKGAGK